MELNAEALKNPGFFADKKVGFPNKLPADKAPYWIHFGAGNIFRGFVARLQQELLNAGLDTHGIIAADPDKDMLERVYDKHDNLSLLVSLLGDGSTEKSVVASVNESVHTGNYARLSEIFRADTLSICSFTITEKGYAVRGGDGQMTAQVLEDTKNEPCEAKNTMCLIAALLYERFLAGARPIAVVSMDNCSKNGDKLRAAVLDAAALYIENGKMKPAFADYLNSASVSFPWSMIDKITPRPDDTIGAMLEKDGFDGMMPETRPFGAPVAPFVNAEKSEYLVIEDDFPAGRPPLEKAGVYFADRKTVNLSERMKVTACLNPLHTAMAVLGCTLGYTRISDMMRDEDIVRLINKIGEEGMKVVEHPGIIEPRAFITELLEKRLPNPYIPDTPQRIACDTSQKVPIRYGETIKAYAKSSELSLSDLTAIPFSIAGWLRYLLKKDDQMNDMPLSPDPRLDELTEMLSSVTPGAPETLDRAVLGDILSDETIFGMSLKGTVLEDKIAEYLGKMLSGKDAVRSALKAI